MAVVSEEEIQRMRVEINERMRALQAEIAQDPIKAALFRFMQDMWIEGYIEGRKTLAGAIRDSTPDDVALWKEIGDIISKEDRWTLARKFAEWFGHRNRERDQEQMMILARLSQLVPNRPLDGHGS